MLKKIFYKIVIGIILSLGIGCIHSCDYLDIDQYINDMQSLDTVLRKKRLLYNISIMYIVICKIPVRIGMQEELPGCWFRMKLSVHSWMHRIHLIILQ